MAGRDAAIRPWSWMYRNRCRRRGAEFQQTCEEKCQIGRDKTVADTTGLDITKQVGWIGCMSKSSSVRIPVRIDVANAKEKQMNLAMTIKVLMPALLAYTATAHADWEWTTWGMHPEQIVAASNGNARLATEEEIKAKSLKQDDQVVRAAKAYAPFSMDGIAFNTWFYFDPKTDALMCVRLVPEKDASLKTLRNRLETTYGPETTETHEKLFSAFWINKIIWSKDDEITLEYGGRGTSIEYCQKMLPSAP